MQRRMASANRCTASRSYRRKLQKRLMHHKQQLEDLEAAKKAFHASTQVWQPIISVCLYSVHMRHEGYE
jgi:baculoviral IAP repeat-containing protein 6